jgi:hypothetical protein
VTGDSNEIFIVHGESGCGKTSVIAKFADEVNSLEIINLSFISIIILNY